MIPNINLIESAVMLKHLDILLSAIESHIAEVRLNIIIRKNDFIIGPLVIATITNIPITPTAFLVMPKEPITLSVASLNNFPKTLTRHSFATDIYK